MKKKFLTKKKGIILAVILVVVVGIGVWRAKAGPGEAPAAMVNTSLVAKQDIEESLTLKAPLEGTESAEIVSRLHNEVIQLNAQEGDKVTKGQIIALLDSETLRNEISKAEDELKLMSLQQSESREKNKNAVTLAELELTDRLETKQDEYEKAVQALETAKINYEKKAILVEKGIETSEALRETKTTYDDAQRLVDTFRVENGKVVATEAERKAITAAANNDSASQAKNIDIAKKALEQKRKDLQDCEIKSPIDGTITRVNIKLGRFADETDDKKPMFVIENIETLKMEVLVSEYDIGKIKIGQPVEITADILQGKTVAGEVGRISPTGEEKQSGSERVIPTTVHVKGDPLQLIAGINAKAKIQIAKAENVLVVPLECLMENADGTTSVVRITDKNTLEILPITTGVENDLEVEIQSDTLAEGDKLVFSPTADLTDGMSVMPTDQGEGTGV